MLKRRPKTPGGKTPAKKKEIDLGTWIRRADAAALAGVTVNTIINWQKEDKVHAVEDYRPDSGGTERRQWVYDPKELVKLRRRDAMRSREPEPEPAPGETAACAFEFFRDGKSDVDVVIALRETPDDVATLREKWLDMGGAAVVISPVAWEALGKVLGPFASPSVTELVERVTALAAREKNARRGSEQDR